MKTLCVERIHSDAKLPTQAYQGDAGFDLYAYEECVVNSHDTIAIRTGLRFAIPGGYAGFVCDKSGLAAKYGLTTLAGVLDSNYRGELKVVLANLGKEPYTIERGQKIAQLVIKKIETPEIVEAKIEDDTVRGEKGFGSSGL